MPDRQEIIARVAAIALENVRSQDREPAADESLAAYGAPATLSTTP